MEKRFCPQCGKEIPADSVFCPECGADVKENVPAAPAAGATGKTKKKLSKGALIGIIAGGVTLIAAAAVVLILVLGGKIGARSFDIDFTTSDAEKFLDKVCRNIDAESVKVVDVEEEEDEETGEKNIAAILKIKLKGEDARNVTFYFNPDDDEEKVQAIYIDFYETTPAEYNCKRAIILGLEKTLGGGKSEKSMKPYEKMGSGTFDIGEGCWISDTVRAELNVSAYEDDGVFGYYNLAQDKKITVSNRKTALIGTWVGYDSDGNQVTYSFASNGSGQYDAVTAYDDEREFRYEVDSDNILKWIRSDEHTYVYFYSKAAMDGDWDCWYIDGDTLYIDGNQLINRG